LFRTAGLVPQSLQLQEYLTLAIIGRCHNSRDCAKSRARRSRCFFQSGWWIC